MYLQNLPLPVQYMVAGASAPVNQTEITSYVNLISDEEIKIEVEPLKKKEYKRIMLNPTRRR